MSPQGSPPSTAVPRWVLQRTVPAAADSAYTVSFSVAARISPATTSGCPYTAPSSLVRHPRVREVGAGVFPETPVRSGFWWYTGQLAVTRGLISGEGGGEGAPVGEAEARGRG